MQEMSKLQKKTITKKQNKTKKKKKKKKKQQKNNNLNRQNFAKMSSAIFSSMLCVNGTRI